MDPFIAVGGTVVLLGVVLSVLALFASRRLVERELASPQSVLVTRAGFAFGVIQTLLTFTLVGWAFFNPNGLLGRFVNQVGVPVFIVVVALVGFPVSALLQRCGITLYYRRSGGG